MVAAIVVLFHVLGVVSSINAVMTARTAQGAIAWGVSLVTFPYIAVPAYWVLGRRNFEGYRKAWIDRHDEVKQFEATMGERLEPFAVETLERIPNYEAMKRLAHSPLLRGNDATLLVDGDATFDSIFEGLAQAEHYALVQFYIIRDDGLGRRLKSALIDCANRGVKVFPDGLPETFWTDHWRCRFLPEGRDAVTFDEVLALLRTLSEAGFDVIKTEHLYTFGGQRGYSLGQGE